MLDFFAELRPEGVYTGTVPEQPPLNEPPKAVAVDLFGMPVETAGKAPHKVRKKEEIAFFPATPGAFDSSEQLGEALDALTVASEVSLDLETTALTPWQAPIAVGGSTKVGTGDTVNQYKKAYGCELDNRPRARILSFTTLSSRKFAFDLDRLQQHERTRLVSALDGKTWVGHNLAFDLQWLRHDVPSVKPGRLVDTFLMTLTIAPEFELCVSDAILGGADLYSRLGHHESWALHLLPFGTEVHKQLLDAVKSRRARKFKSDAGEASRGLPLDFLSMALLHQKLDKDFQTPHNWMLSTLSPRHHEYCLADITQPPVIARLVLNLPASSSTAEMLAALDAHCGGHAYNALERAVPVLSRMQRNGLRLDALAVSDYVECNRRAADASLEALFQELPSLEPYRQNILDGGQTEQFKAAFAKALEERTGKHPGCNAEGEPILNAKHLKLVYRDLPALKRYLEAQGAIKRAAMASAYLAQADSEGRLHPLIVISALTCRTTSQEPNLQNMPRDKAFRTLFRARAGFKILAIDYGAIEMRIAAALAMRAYRAVRALIDAILSGRRHEYAEQVRKLRIGWLLGHPGKPNNNGSASLIDCLVHLLAFQELPPGAPDIIERPAAGVSEPSEWGTYYVAEFWRVVVLMWRAGAFQVDPAKDRLTLSEVFSKGLDPHIITAVSTEVLAGRYDTGGKPALEYVKLLEKGAQKALKESLKGARQAAKPTNFGLLYLMSPETLHSNGITEYDLSWDQAEAASAHGAWFQLYPEVSLWHMLTRFGNVKVVDPDNLGQKKKIYRTATLSGRPVVTDALNNALNYQDQGTGAEIALSALGNLSDEIQEYLVDFVHDELVLEVPEGEVECTTREVDKTLIAAADELLLPWGVPTEAEPAVADFWVH
ncbi:MAG: DNA polymerase [Betaproteobacteria bacterium]|nr:DNA polymerase [Betaproteobacteria bacterium]